MLLLVVGSTIWLGIDASQRDWTDSPIARSAGAWVFGSLVVWIVFFPLYLAYRSKAPMKETLALASAPSTVATMKTCPECAEPVRVAARKCRYCGHRFEDSE
jgi:hypothetical protein